MLFFHFAATAKTMTVTDILTNQSVERNIEDIPGDVVLTIWKGLNVLKPGLSKPTWTVDPVQVLETGTLATWFSVELAKDLLESFYLPGQGYDGAPVNTVIEGNRHVYGEPTHD